METLLTRKKRLYPLKMLRFHTSKNKSSILWTHHWFPLSIHRPHLHEGFFDDPFKTEISSPVSLCQHSLSPWPPSFFSKSFKILLIYNLVYCHSVFILELNSTITRYFCFCLLLFVPELRT